MSNRRRVRKQKKNLSMSATAAFAVILLAAAVFLVGVGLGWWPKKAVIASAFPADVDRLGEQGMSVHMLDVGQGDSLMVASKGEVMLVDAGTNESGDTVCNYLGENGVTRLDLVVGTHPHEDHIGGLDTVLENFPVDEMWMPDRVSDSKTYKEVLEAANAKGIQRRMPQVGEVKPLGGAEITVLGPVRQDYDSTNDVSLVMTARYGDFGMLLTGDAERQALKDILDSANRKSLLCQVLKVGHHGSGTSTFPELLDAVGPEVALISLGAGNSYGHPHKEVLDALMGRKVAVYRTDLMGSMMVETDGETYRIYVEEQTNGNELEPAA